MIEAFTFPVLSAIIFVPVVGMLIILFMDGERRDLVRGVALSAAAIVFLLSLGVYIGYSSGVNGDDGLLAEQDDLLARRGTLVEEDGARLFATRMFHDGIAYEEEYVWVESLGISYHVGVDGLSAPMVLLTGIVALGGVLVSWNIEDRLREFMAFFLLLTTGVMGVFISLDMFLLFFFYELAIFPMYLLIAGWGWVELREYASMKLTLYILVGSVIALVGVIALVFVAQDYFQTPEGAAILTQAQAEGIIPEGAGAFSFNMTQLTLAAENGAFDVGGYAGASALTFAKFWFPMIFIGFGVLAGVFPFHNWSPDGHVAAPTAVSMIHAGVLMKMGAYAALRSGVQLLPVGARLHLPWIVFLTLINVVYGAFIAFRQRDFKYVIGFSSVSHMGLVSMGWATMNVIGMTGAGIQMFSHGVMTALFFCCVGMVYDRAHTRDIPSLGGFAKKMPWVAIAFIIGGLTSMGMPGLSGFIAEFPIFTGMWNASQKITLQIGTFTLSNYYAVIVCVAALGIVITAAYVLRVVGQVFFGEFDSKKYPEVGDIPITDRAALILMTTPLILIGMLPWLMAPMVEAGVQPVFAILGGGL